MEAVFRAMRLTKAVALFRVLRVAAAVVLQVMCLTVALAVDRRRRAEWCRQWVVG
jgi:hypothetical protein